MSQRDQTTQSLTLPATRNKDWADCELALNILTACREDLKQLLAAVPPSKRSSNFNRAASSLSDRISAGEQIREERHNAQS